MKSILVAVAFVAGAAAQSMLTVNTPVPNPPVCQPVQLTWSGGSPPYFLSLRDANGGNTLEDFGQQTGTSFRWVVNQPVGTSLGLDLRDNNGVVAQSGTFSVATGPDTSCLSGGSTGSTSAAGSTTDSSSGSTTSSGTTSVTTSTSVSVTTSSAPAGSTTSSAGTVGATTSGTSTRATGSSTSASRSSTGSSTSSATSSSSNAAAPKAFIEMGAAGIIGAVAVALFA